MIAASVPAPPWVESGQLRVPPEVGRGGDHRAAVLEPHPGVGQQRRGQQRVRRLGAARPLPEQLQQHASRPVHRHDVREEAPVRRPGRVVPVAVEGGTRQRAFGQVEDPDVPPLDRAEVQREPAAVGREQRVMEVPPLRRGQPARAVPLDEHQRRRLLRDVGDVAVPGDGELGDPVPGDRHVGRYRHRRRADLPPARIERRRLQGAGTRHEHEHPLGHPRLDDRSAQDLRLGPGPEIHQHERAGRIPHPRPHRERRASVAQDLEQVVSAFVQLGHQRVAHDRAQVCVAAVPQRAVGGERRVARDQRRADQLLGAAVEREAQHLSL